MVSRQPVDWLARQTGVSYRWFVVACCFGLSAMTFGTIYSYTVFFEPIRATFGGSHANTSLLFGVQTFVTFGSASAFGIAIDRYGVRRLLAVAALLLTAGFVGASQLDSYPAVILSYSGVVALGLGSCYVVAYTTPAQWFDDHSASATAFAVSGTGIGILVVPPLAERSIRLVGWRASYLVLMGVFLITIGVSILTLRQRPETETDCGGKTHTIQPVSTDEPNRLTVSQHLLFALVFVAFFCAFVPTYATSVYFVEFAQSTGIGRSAGILSVSVFGGASVGIKLTTGPISTRAGIVPTMAGFAAAMSAATLSLVGVQTTGSLIAAAAVLGAGYGGFDALLSPLLATLFGVERLGTMFGTVAVAFALAGSIVPYAVGAGFDQFGSFEIPFVLAAGAGSGAVVALAVISRVAD